MKVKELIEQLLKHDSEKEVYVQVAEDGDCEYLVAQTVRDKYLNDIHDDYTEMDVVVIDYM